MNPDQLLQHFDRISEAPDAIPRLRRFILDLAVRGKLVEQDPSDEPALELLKRIHKAKEAQKLKPRSKTVKPNDDENFDFRPPAGWELADLGTVALKITDGAHKTPTYVESGVPFISVKDFSNGQLSFSNTRFIPQHEHELLYQRCDPKKGDIILGRIGTLGKAVLVDVDIEFSLFVSVGLIRFSHECFVPEYFRLVLNSPFVEREFDRIKVGGGTHTNKLNLGDLHSVAFPIPPLPEQHRIVAKVDELMALCDQLQSAQTEREQSRDRLVAASLHSLNPPADDGTANAPEVQREQARFIFNHLPRLTTSPAHIKQLRQTILNLAVRGKLVAQDPSDEPALELLKRIQMQRVASGIKPKTKKAGELCVSHAKPLGWEWCEIEALAKLVTDGEHATPTRILEQEIPLVTAKNVRDGEMDYSITDWVSRETAEKAWKRCKPEVGDILLVCVGATTGRLCILQDNKEMVLVRSVAQIRPEIGIDVNYLALAIRSPLGQTQIWGSVKATAQPCLYINKINSLSFPLPPIAEQHRIVAKVDELMALCDQLETQLTNTSADSRRLLEAVLHEALLPPEQAA